MHLPPVREGREADRACGGRLPHLRRAGQDDEVVLREHVDGGCVRARRDEHRRQRSSRVEVGSGPICGRGDDQVGCGADSEHGRYAEAQRPRGRHQRRQLARSQHGDLDIRDRDLRREDVRQREQRLRSSLVRFRERLLEQPAQAIGRP
jgi:hypothetical protein